MTINDAVFGELEFSGYDWIGRKTIDFFAEEVIVSLMIRGEEDGQFEEEQYSAYNSFFANWNELQQDILASILEYYKQTRRDLGYNVEDNENYPLIEKNDQLLDKITLVGMFIADKDLMEILDIGLMFDCTWDSENGLGICFVQGKITEVGYQDVVI
jgi:hypothetical protein